jgi:ABC-2 type transport system permease protein
MQALMILTTPILTMNAFASERQKGTDKLFFTAPVSTAKVVWGKFWAACTLFTIILALSALWVLIVYLIGGELPLLEYLGIWAGMLCLAPAYISLGMLISALSKTPAGALSKSLAVFLLAFSLDTMAAGRHVPASSLKEWAAGRLLLPQPLSEWLHIVSFSDKLQSIVSGIVSPAHLVFFLSFGLAFLFLTSTCLERKRWA